MAPLQPSDLLPPNTPATLQLVQRAINRATKRILAVVDDRLRAFGMRLEINTESVDSISRQLDDLKMQLSGALETIEKQRLQIELLRGSQHAADVRFLQEKVDALRETLDQLVPAFLEQRGHVTNLRILELRDLSRIQARHKSDDRRLELLQGLDMCGKPDKGAQLAAGYKATIRERHQIPPAPTDQELMHQIGRRKDDELLLEGGSGIMDSQG